MNPENVRAVDLPRMSDCRGNLTFLEAGRMIPFEVKRLYYIYDVPQNAARGGLAHRQCEKLLVAISGRFDVVTDDGFSRNCWRLDHPAKGLYIRSGVWHELHRFAPGTVCLVLASTFYDAGDYQRDYGRYRDSLAAAAV